MSMLLLIVRVAGLGLLACLEACEGPPWTLSQSPAGISLRWYPDELPITAAEWVAQQHCRSWSKTAELSSDEQDGSAEIAKYNCR